MRVTIKPSKAKGKKYTAVFFNEKGDKVKTTNFGAKGYTDYIQSRDKERRKRYLQRHKNENWNDYMSAGSLSRWILWGKSEALKTNISNYKKRFNLK